jgi:hypothetical protein
MRNGASEAFVQKSIAYALHTVRWLDDAPERWDDRVANHPSVCLLEKVHSEVSLLGLIVSRFNIIESDHIHSALDQIARCMGAQHYVQRAIERVVRLPQLSPAFSLPIRYRETRGVAGEVESRLIRNALSHQLVEAIERFPFRRLDVAWIKKQFDLPNQLNNRNLLESTCLSSPVHPIYASLTDIYGLTHAIFYHSDFGNKSLNCDIFNVDAIASNLHASAAFALSEGNLDLLAELACCAWCLPKVPSWAPAVRDFVCTIWKKFGFIAGTEFEASLLAVNDNSSKWKSYLMQSTYHPTLVAGIMIAVALQKNNKEIEAVEVPSRYSIHQYIGDLKSIKRDLPAMGNHIMQVAFSDCDEYFPGMAPLFFEAALIQACRHYDLDVLMELLERDSSYVISPNCSAAAIEFFRLQEVGDGLFGVHFLNRDNLDLVSLESAKKDLTPRIRSIIKKHNPD